MPFTRRLFAAIYMVVFLIGSSAFVTEANSYSPHAGPEDAQNATTPPTRRALLIGINTYKPEQEAKSKASGPGEKVTPNRQPPSASKGEVGGRGEFSNLTGPQNDVKEMRAVIEKKYGFTDVKTLEDRQATRDAILKGINDLIDRSSKGDICFFYYSGHGSRVRNSKNGEAKGYDESIVPADSNRGALDIRDKELARLFLKAIDKGVVLTAVFDSCHSGSISRGGNNPEEKTRALAFDERDVADEPGFTDPPEKKGALVLSAAQDYEQAKERSYTGVWRGNFSWALIEVLKRDTTSKDESAGTIFQKTVALMSNKEVREQPVFAANDRRRNATLFDAEPSRASVPVATVSGIDKNEFVLQGGLAMGLGVGSELKRKDSGKDVKPIRLRVVAMLGLSACRTQAIEENYKPILVGDAFVLDRWVSQNANTLKVWIPTAVDEKQLSAIAQNLQALQKSGRAQLVDDPTDTAPARFVQYGESGWQAWLASGQTEKLGAVASFSSMAVNPGEKVFISIPPTAALRSALKFGPESKLAAIALASSPQEAQYVLAGRLRDNNPEYAWVRPGATSEDAGKAGDPLPVRSDWVADAAGLEEKAVTLSRINGWRELKSSTDEPFPFKLALRNSATGEIIQGGQVYEGQRYDLVLVPEDAAKKANAAAPINRQRVYVFAIDSFGQSTLLFPLSNVENRFPLDPADQEKGVYEKPYTEPIQLGKKGLLKMSPPFGLDTYVLLASDQSIPDPNVLAFEGARSKGASRGNESALSRLAYGLGSGTRGPTPDEPLSWSIEKMFLRSSKSP